MSSLKKFSAWSYLFFMIQLPKIYKRTPYKDHKSKTDEIPLVINAFKIAKRGDIKKISLQTNISINTLKDWIKKLNKDSDFSPTRPKYGISRKIFTEEEENEIANFIKEQIIRRGYFFNDDDFRELIMCEYLRKYKDSDDIIPFNASDGYIVNFKNKHKISSKKSHVKRRPDKNLLVDNFLKTVEDLKESEDNDFFCNPTSWEVFPKNILVWQEKGKDTISKYFNKANPKVCLTALLEYLHLEQRFQ